MNVQIWLNMQCKLLSKTKQQYIAVVSSFKNVEVSTIKATDNSTLHSSDLNLNNLLTNSLMKNTPQIIDAAWHFEELYISKAVLTENSNIVSILKKKKLIISFIQPRQYELGW